MDFWRILFKRETIVPVLALLFASGVSFTLVSARIVYTGNWRYAFLLWNLFLAWLPLVFALLASEKIEAARKPTWPFAGWTAVWLLFFPNAPYIVTDVVHLTTPRMNNFWVDLTLVLTCAFTGLVIGFVSLYLMQTIARRLFGRAASWLFIVAITALSSIGICIGRFLRFNSWDILVQPFNLVQELAGWAGSLSHPSHFAFPVLFTLFLFTAYLMLYALTHLSENRIPNRAQHDSRANA